MDRHTIFIGYSHKHRRYLDELLEFLRPFESQNLLSLWSDEKLKAGDDWDDEIQNAIERASVALLLVSQNFVDSEYIEREELAPLLAAAARDEVIVAPLYVSTSTATVEQLGFQVDGQKVRISRYQGLNDPAEPLAARGLDGGDYDAFACCLLATVAEHDHRCRASATRSRAIVRSWGRVLAPGINYMKRHGVAGASPDVAPAHGCGRVAD